MPSRTCREQPPIGRMYTQTFGDRCGPARTPALGSNFRWSISNPPDGLVRSFLDTPSCCRPISRQSSSRKQKGKGKCPFLAGNLARTAARRKRVVQRHHHVLDAASGTSLVVTKALSSTAESTTFLRIYPSATIASPQRLGETGIHQEPGRRASDLRSVPWSWDAEDRAGLDTMSTRTQTPNIASRPLAALVNGDALLGVGRDGDARDSSTTTPDAGFDSWLNSPDDVDWVASIPATRTSNWARVPYKQSQLLPLPRENYEIFEPASNLSCLRETAFPLSPREMCSRQSHLTSKVLLSQLWAYPKMLITGYCLPPFIFPQCALQGRSPEECVIRRVHITAFRRPSRHVPV